MLHLPSQILEACQLSNLRHYGVLVYHKVSTKQERYEHTGETSKSDLFSSSFKYSVDSDQIAQQIFTQMDNILYDSNNQEEEQVTILPPLFLRSNSDLTIVLKPNAFLVALASGPVVPVLTSVNDTTLSLIINLYSIVSEQFYNSNTAVSLLSAV
jgi:hypothetical protein